MHPWTMTETVAGIASRLDSGTFTQHVVVNVAKLVNMQKDRQLLASVQECDIVNIDGAGVVPAWCLRGGCWGSTFPNGWPASACSCGCCSLLKSGVRRFFSGCCRTSGGKGCCGNPHALSRLEDRRLASRLFLEPGASGRAKDQRLRRRDVVRGTVFAKKGEFYQSLERGPACQVRHGGRRQLRCRSG